MKNIKSEEAPTYQALGYTSPAAIKRDPEEEEIINRALDILCRRLGGEALTDPRTVGQYLQLHHRDREHEVFGCLWLNTRHRVIGRSEIFRGTVDGAAVYPREVVKEALANNAAAVVFYHNHPSGDPSPSAQDVQITEKLKKALALVDVRTLDHVIVGNGGWASLAERGLI